MTRYKRYLELKEDLKSIAKEIRKWKNNRKQDRRREIGKNIDYIDFKIRRLKHQFRYKHVVYCCYMRDTSYEDVERKCHTSLDICYLTDLREEWLGEEQKTFYFGA